MTGPRPEKTTTQKMRENLAYLRSKGASRERIQQEIDRWDADLQQESANERKLSGVEKVAAVGSKLGSGATFGLLDEALDVTGISDKEEHRFLQRQLSEENPALAMGAEVAGGLAMPGSIFSAPAKLAKTATAAEKARRAVRVVGTPLAEGFAQGGLAGVGNAEGSLEERLQGGLEGGTAGSVVAGAISGVGRGVGAARRAAASKRGVHTPTLDELVMRTPDEDIAVARTRYSELQGRNLGSEATVADVLPQGEAALRAQATASKGTRSKVDATLRDRSNRLANTADDRLSQHTGTERMSGAKGRAERLKKAQEEAGPLYEQSRQEAAAYDMTNAEPDFTTPEVLNRPRIAQAVKRVIRDDPERFAGNVFSDPKLSHDVLDQAYKDMGEDIRYLQAKVKAKTATAAERRSVKRMIRDRTHLKDAISVRSETYPKALDTYAGEIAHRDAFDMGGKNTPADMIPDEMSVLDAATVPDYKQGKVGTLRANVPNADLGEFARFSDVLAPVANREKAEVFKATFGEKAYKEYLADLLEMAKLQRMKAGAGESTTVDKLIEQMQANPDLLGIAGQLAQGNMGAAARGIVGKAMDLTPLDRLLASQKQSGINADFLLRSGDDVPKTLEEMVGLREAAKKPTRGTVRQMRGRDGGYTGRGSNVAARTVGGYFGRN